MVKDEELIKQGPYLMLFFSENLLGSPTSFASVFASAAYPFQSLHRIRVKDNITIPMEELNEFKTLCRRVALFLNFVRAD